MILRKVEPSEVPAVYSWLIDPQNSQWLDLDGEGVNSPAQLQSMLAKETDYLRLFQSSRESEPLGLVALRKINRTFATAMPWYVLGCKSHAGKFYMAQAVSQLMQAAFGEIGLRSLHAWAVETNIPSIKLLRYAGFRFIGRQRRCHVIDGHVLDRLWFDLLNSEYRERIAGHPGVEGLGCVPTLEFPRRRRDSA